MNQDKFISEVQKVTELLGVEGLTCLSGVNTTVTFFDPKEVTRIVSSIVEELNQRIDQEKTRLNELKTQYEVIKSGYATLVEQAKAEYSIEDEDPQEALTSLLEEKKKEQEASLLKYKELITSLIPQGE